MRATGSDRRRRARRTRGRRCRGGGTATSGGGRRRRVERGSWAGSFRAFARDGSNVRRRGPSRKGWPARDRREPHRDRILWRGRRDFRETGGWIHTSLALVLTGGGARAAYQVGVLCAIAERAPEVQFPILTGVSAGAINAVYLAAHRRP